VAIPVRDDSPRREVPWVVLTLIAVNVFVFLFLQPPALQRGGADTGHLTEEESRELAEHFSGWGAVPCEIKVMESRAEGARCTSDGDHPIIDRKPVPFTLLTSMFLHGGILHLTVNMLFLWVFGAAVEGRLGPGGFAVLYLLGGVAGTLTYVAVNPGSAAPVVGASGAVSAAMGAYLWIGPRRRILSIVAPLPLAGLVLPAWALIGPYAVSQFLTPDDATIAWQAHVGGLVAGFVLAVLFTLGGSVAARRRRRREAADARIDPASWTLPDRPPVTSGVRPQM